MKLNHTLILGTVAHVAAAVFNVMPAEAAPVRVAQDVWSAYDDNNNEHIIKVERQDREGDFLIEVSVPARRTSQHYWVDCAQDLIALPGADSQWYGVDHRKMEGWYSDVACRLN